MTTVHVVSSLDRTKQPSQLFAPEVASSRPTPVLIWLHSWNAHYRQKLGMAYLPQAVKRSWILLLPHFRGRNNRPEAGGSELAQADILDALNYVQDHFSVDATRIYLAGASGGGHMALLMAGKHPSRFSAVSAWAPMTDLGEWYRFHSVPDSYGHGYSKDIQALCGGPPGTSLAIDAQYHARSPINHLDNIKRLPIDLAAGVRDEIVPIAHSVGMFNRIAAQLGAKDVSNVEKERLAAKAKLYSSASTTDTKLSYDSRILLRRHAGPMRLTIINAGHVPLPDAPETTVAWLATQQRVTQRALYK